MKFLTDYLKDRCLSCKICCRFAERYSPLIPYFFNSEMPDLKYFPCISKTYGCRINLLKTNNIYSCPFFNHTKNNCAIYEERPFDCRLYPFMITYDPTYTKVSLVLDNNCPYSKELIIFSEGAKKYVENIILAQQNLGIINDPQPDTVFLCELPKLTEFIFGESRQKKKISFGDRKIFDLFPRNMSSLHFTSLFLWKDIMNIVWNIDNDNLQILYGSDKTFSGFKPAGKEYVYLKKDLIELKGDKYKDKRNLCNYFDKNYSYTINTLIPDDNTIETLIAFSKQWANSKIKKQKNDYYKQLLEDSLFFHRRAFLDFKALGLEGIELKIDNKLAGYTFGFGLNKDTFCILGEITDNKFKGINQFIFREFCRTIPENYLYINAMDDSDIEGLRKNKLSYHPLNKTL